MTDGYQDSMETEKRIVACGSGYVVRVTREIALMGLNPGDTVRVTLTRIEGEEKDECD